MAERRKKLRKQSGGKIKPPKNFQIYLDENLCDCQPIINVLKNRHITAHRHLDHFDRGVPDHIWLPLVGRNKWILLTTDKRFRYNDIERFALREHNVQCFEFFDNRIGKNELAESLNSALKEMIKIKGRRTKCFVASISKLGHVKMKWDYRWRKSGKQTKPVA
jgi:hypothetical protein